MSTMLPLKKILLICSIMLIVTPSSAANLYKEGSTPYRMFKVIEPVIGDVTPVFILGDEPLRFVKSLDSKALKSAGVREETLRYYLANLKPESKAHGLNGYAFSGSNVPGNEVKSLTCAIVIASDEKMKTTSTMFHESIHCKNFAALRDNREAWLMAASLNVPALGMTTGQFMSLFQEVLAAYMQVAYASNLGLQDGMAMVRGAAVPDRNTATSIGFRTARNALKRCSVKDACSTDPVAVTRMLAESPADRADFLLDLKELHEAAVASGYVVENK